MKKQKTSEITRVGITRVEMTEDEKKEIIASVQDDWIYGNILDVKKYSTPVGNLYSYKYFKRFEERWYLGGSYNYIDNHFIFRTFNNDAIVNIEVDGKFVIFTTLIDGESIKSLYKLKGLEFIYRDFESYNIFDNELMFIRDRNARYSFYRPKDNRESVKFESYKFLNDWLYILTNSDGDKSFLNLRNLQNSCFFDFKSYEVIYDWLYILTNSDGDKSFLNLKNLQNSLFFDLESYNIINNKVCIITHVDGSKRLQSLQYLTISPTTSYIEKFNSNIVNSITSIMQLKEVYQIEFNFKHNLVIVRGAESYPSSSGVGQSSFVSVFIDGKEVIKKSFMYRDTHDEKFDDYSYHFEDMKIERVSCEGEQITLDIRAVPTTKQFRSTYFDMCIKK